MNTTTIAADLGVAADIEQRASAVLRAMGLSVADAVRLLLTRIANEGRFPFVDAATPQKDGQENWLDDVLAFSKEHGFTDEEHAAFMQAIRKAESRPGGIPLTGAQLAKALHTIGRELELTDEDFELMEHVIGEMNAPIEPVVFEA